MHIKAQLTVLVLAAILFVIIIRLVRIRALRDTYALVWMIVGVMAVLVSLIPAAIWDRIALAVGIQSGGATLLLVLAVFGLLVLIMQTSLALTRLERLVREIVISESVERASGETLRDGPSMGSHE